MSVSDNKKCIKLGYQRISVACGEYSVGDGWACATARIAFAMLT